MHFYFWNLLAWLTIALFSLGHPQFVKKTSFDFCPKYCDCNLFNGRNRADCSFKRLINPAVEVGDSVEILDISYNDFTYLDDNCFKDYYFLIHLSVAHNAIHTIHVNAFSSLGRIVSIDLSYNRLEMLDERLIEANLFLNSLNLEGNRFMWLQNKTFLRSKCLQVLNLRNSQLNFIHMELFSGLPQLRQLDISQNMLITLDVAAFCAVPRVQQIHLSENRWHCDQSIWGVFKNLQDQGINVTSNDCMIPKESEAIKSGKEVQFERLELINSEEERFSEEVDPVTESTEESSSPAFRWRPLYRINDASTASTLNLGDTDEQDFGSVSDFLSSNEDCNTTLFRVYDKYKSCQIGMQLLLEASGNFRKIATKTTYTEDDLLLALLMGVVIGMSVIITAICFALCQKALSKWSLSDREQRIHRVEQQLLEEGDGEPFRAPVPVPAPAPAPVPVRPGRRPRRRANNSRAILRYESALQPPTNSTFIGRLFGRPARHQYYRTINENTVTLIRCLSQSNLFNNRANRTANSHTTENPNSNPAQMPKARPSTPPPSYHDAIHCNDNSSDS